MNAAELQIKGETVNYTTKSGSKVLQPVRSWNFPEDEIYVLEFHQKLSKGTGILVIGQFTGLLGNNFTGFYRSKYDVNGTERYMAVTQFEPTYARRCFPCWDEPALKATFQVTLEVPSHLTALSNVPIIDEKYDGYMKTVFFQETPVISTYLVAVVIGLFDHVEDKTSDAYPLPKLDMVGIPEFYNEAMENFGLVTFRPWRLYVTPESDNLSKHEAADTIAHELSHQWCGNLVTMEWWTDVWLNEGFASWLSVYAVDKIFPEWDMWTQFATETTSLAFCATIRDLWRALEKASGKPVGRVMSKWIEQQGFPVLSADAGNVSLRLKQTSFSSGGRLQVWNIPVTMACGSYNAFHQFLLEQPEKAVRLNDLPGCSCTDVACPWIKINVNQTGFYRVRYSRNLMTRLDSAAAKKILSKNIG
uniref:Uncharacterized protein n=1 Tax=Kalanchoe fedtschenkoi TaxID=63787 RepID=A0A7N0SV66_KALFE